MKFLILFLSGIVLTSCSSVMPKMDSDIKYQRDIRFTVQYWENGNWGLIRSFTGVGVVKWSPKYRVEVFAPGKADMMTLTSCHREIKTPNPDSKGGGWFSKRRYPFEFRADDMIERGKLCMINIGIYEKKKGRHGWGLIAIEHPDAKMGAFVRCNGTPKEWKGTSFCQAKEGLVQRIEFSRPVSTTMYGDCFIKKPEDGMNWEYLMPRGRCVLSFFDENLNEHVHYMYGYDTIPIRGVE